MSSHRLLSLAIGVAALPATAFAQAVVTGERGSAVLEEVVVTAERREASLQSVPISVTALSAEALENKQVYEAKDLARYTPSLKMFNNITSPTNLSPSLRGSLTQDASLIVAESPFGIYVDDVYIARLNGNNVALADIERVEVLRGPQGTLYGRNTLTGAIKFVSRTPGETPWLNADVGAGNFGQIRAGFSAGGPLGGNGWAGSLSGLYTNKEDQFFNRHPSVNDDSGQEENWVARAKLAYTGIENFVAEGSFSYSEATNDSGQLVPASTPSVPANRQFTSDDLVAQYGSNYTLNTQNVARAPAPITALPEGSTKQTIASLKLSYDFGAATLRSITGYVKTEDFFSTDFSGNGLVNGANDADVDQISEELQVIGTALDDRLSYIVGAYLFKEEGDQTFGWNSYLPPIFLTAVPISQSLIKMETTSYSAFAQVDYNFADNLKASLGLRYTSDDKDFDFAFRSFIGAPPTTILLSDTFSETTPKFSLDYTVPASGSVDSMLLYVSAAKAFKSGGYSAIAIFSPADVAPYDPETNWTYEVGIKTDLLANRLRINANYFYSDVEDVVINFTLPGGRFPVDNAGDQTIQGLEFEIVAVPIDGLNLFVNGSLLDGEYSNLNPNAAPALAPMSFGVEASPPQIPDYSFTVGFDYGIDLSFGRLSFGADWFQTDDYVTAATNDFKVKSYGIGTAFIGLGFGDNWTAKATVKNFTDEDQFTTGSRGFLGGFIPLRPREYLFTVSYDLN
jgi:iron complex outermembrane receptor protein